MTTVTSPARVAVIGAGISGLAAAHALRDVAAVTLFEASDYFGGHAHTATIELPRSASDATRVAHGVDTGFLVYNDRTYPNLIRLFAELGVDTALSEMSFSVQATRDDGGPLEWSGNNLGTVFAQRRNLLDPPLPRHAGRPAALQPPDHAHRPGRHRRRTGPAAGPVPGRPPLRRGVSRLVLPAHDGLHLELLDHADAGVSRWRP
jgi:hypothetical protein